MAIESLTVFCEMGAIYTADGVKNGGKAVKLKQLNTVANPSVNSVRIVCKTNGWKHLLYA